MRSNRHCQQRVPVRSGRAAFLGAALAAALVCVSGCCCSQYSQPGAPNVDLGAYDPNQPDPLFVKTKDPEALWDAIVDVIDNYYEIDVENPIRTYSQTGKDGATYEYQTEGRIDTKPSIVGGSAEPWRKNSAECGKKCFATLQTVRSTATVRVVPEGKGFFVYLAVYEELEDLPNPIGSTSGVKMQYNDDRSKLQQALGERQRSKGWIPVGRNAEQESRILKEIGWRAGVARTIIHQGVRDAELKP